jgi:hypothetical protein
MTNLSPLPTPRQPPQRLAAQRVRTLLTTADPGYGRDFTDAEWEQIAERLTALARLIWRMSERRAAPGAVPPLPQPRGDAREGMAPSLMKTARKNG